MMQHFTLLYGILIAQYCILNWSSTVLLLQANSHRLCPETFLNPPDYFRYIFRV